MRLEFEADAAVVPAAQERRRHKREDLCFKVRFHVLGADDALQALDALEHGPGRPRDGEWYMQNLSSGGLGLCGPVQALHNGALKEGDVLKLEIQPPRTRHRLRCLGEVTWVEWLPGTGLFRAGVAFIGVHPGDLEQMKIDET
ncbi:MAG: PilZ domain-containing protein [bacterium]